MWIVSRSHNREVPYRLLDDCEIFRGHFSFLQRFHYRHHHHHVVLVLYLALRADQLRKLSFPADRRELF